MPSPLLYPSQSTTSKTQAACRFTEQEVLLENGHGDGRNAQGLSCSAPQYQTQCTGLELIAQLSLPPFTCIPTQREETLSQSPWETEAAISASHHGSLECSALPSAA